MPPVPRRPIVARIMSLALTPSASSPGVVDAHRLRAALDQGLGRQDVLDLGGADSERERAEGAVGGRMGVAADDRHPRLGDAQLGSDHVDDPAAVRAQGIQRHAELLAVGLQGLDLLAGELVGDHPRDRSVVGRDVVVGRGERLVGPPDLAAREAEPVEGLRRGDLVDEMEVDVDQARRRPRVAPRSCRTSSLGSSSVPRSRHLVHRSVSFVSARRRPRPGARPSSRRGSRSDGEGRRRRWRCRRSRAGGPRRRPPARPRPTERRRSRGCPARGSADRRRRRSRRPASSRWRETSARWPGSGGVSSSISWPRPAAPATAAAADDDHVAALVEPQQLREGQLEAGGDPGGDGQRRAGLAALDLRQHRGADAAALGQVAQRQAHRLAQRLDPGADRDRVARRLGRRRRARRRFGRRRRHHGAYVITYRCPVSHPRPAPHALPPRQSNISASWRPFGWIDRQSHPTAPAGE